MVVNEKTNGDRMILDFQYKVQSGPSQLQSYGLALANVSN